MHWPFGQNNIFSVCNSGNFPLDIPIEKAAFYHQDENLVNLQTRR